MANLFHVKLCFAFIKAFILPHFHYCSMIWHFCNSEDSVKLDTLNRRILRFVFKDWDSNYDTLLGQGWSVWFSQQEDKKYDDLYIQMSPFW